PETADAYLWLFNELRRAFGGAVDADNADAIALAACELYGKDVELKLWEHMTAHEVLDSFDVPRAGAFTPYSLSDRLLMLRRSAGPDRRERAHVLLTDLRVEEHDEYGARLSLKDRLQLLLDGVGPLPPISRQVSEPGEGKVPAGHARPSTGDLEGMEAQGGPSSRRAVDAPGTAHQRAGTDSGETPAIQVTGPAAAELAALRAAVVIIQEDLTGIRQAVGTLQVLLDEALGLLRPGTEDRVALVLAPTAPAVPVADTFDAPTAEESDGVDLVLGDPEEGAEGALPPPPPVTPDDVGEPVTVTPADLVLEEATPVPPPRRRLRLPMLMVIAVVVGLVIAGVAIAISIVGWSELRSGLHTGWADAVAAPVRYGASLHDVVERLVVVMQPSIGPS
ncbi:MAG: hypothetical protein M3450_02685, partial [Actinomycetota bacterium]|nr:hypothetical protein [Actinomycetota bacterium]